MTAASESHGAEGVGLKSASVRPGGALIAVLTVAATALACTNAHDSDRPASSASPPSTTGLPTTAAAQPPPTTRPACEVALPPAWQAAIEGSGVSTGGVSTVPVDVGRAGEVAAVRDNGDTRDVLLIGADKSVTKIYEVPDPSRNNVGFVATDDRWLVVGVIRIPRGSNGVLPALIRIDAMDRQGGAVRTVVQQSEADYVAGRNALDSVALFGGKVYWITRETYAGTTGTVRAYDLGSGAVADVASGTVRDLRATAAGVTWYGEGTRADVKVPAQLPAPVVDAVGTGQDRLTLATDGTAYAWVTGVDQGGTGVAWWAPGSGLVRVSFTGDVIRVKDWLPPVYVVGPYVVIDDGRAADTKQETHTTVVDTRSGAVIYLTDRVAGADGGTIAIHLPTGTSETARSRGCNPLRLAVPTHLLTNGSGRVSPKTLPRSLAAPRISQIEYGGLPVEAVLFNPPTLFAVLRAGMPPVMH